MFDNPTFPHSADFMAAHPYFGVTRQYLNRLSIDDCSILGRLANVNPSLNRGVNAIVEGASETSLSPDQRARQVDAIDDLCSEAVASGIDLRTASLPHECASAWLIWLKVSNEEALEDASDIWEYHTEPITREPRETMGYRSRNMLRDRISRWAASWQFLVTRDPYERSVDPLFRAINERVYPKTKRWHFRDPNGEIGLRRFFWGWSEFKRDVAS
jgi:hypothetical protein